MHHFVRSYLRVTSFSSIDSASNFLRRTFSVSNCADNAAVEEFIGMIKRERIHRQRYLSLADARSDVYDYIERFHNPRMQRKIDARDLAFTA